MVFTYRVTLAHIWQKIYPTSTVWTQGYSLFLIARDLTTKNQIF